jgi:molybdopterin-guanine dinucleotide biosynthesis protein A
LKIGCIVLAGGKGKRLGTEKSWVELGGQTLLQRAVANLEFLGSDIAIVRAPGTELPPVITSTSLKVVQDSVNDKDHWKVSSQGCRIPSINTTW